MSEAHPDGYDQQFWRPQEAALEQIEWLRELLCDEPTVSLYTIGEYPNGYPYPHATTLYSAFTEAFGDLRLLWISYPGLPDKRGTGHSAHIERDIAASVARGGPAEAPVSLELRRSSTRKVTLQMEAMAHRVEDAEEERLSLAIINGIRTVLRFNRYPNRRQGEEEDHGLRTLGPHHPYDTRKAVYAAIIRSDPIIQAPQINQHGYHVGETHALVPLKRLRGFRWYTRPD